MQRNFLLALLVSMMTSALLAQNPLTKQTYQRYDGQAGVWVTETILSWEYNTKEQEKRYTWWNHYQGPFQPYNNQERKTEYHTNGQVKFIQDVSWGDTLSAEILNHYYYNDQKALQKIQHIHHFSNGDGFTEEEVYEISLSENRRTKKVYQSTASAMDLVLDHQRDSIFDASGNLVKQTILNFDDEGQKIDEKWWTSDFLPNGKLKETGYWLRNTDTGTMYLFRRERYSYEEAINLTTINYEKIGADSNDWIPQFLITTTQDEEGKVLHYFFENYIGTVTDTIEQFYTYTPEGLLSVFKEYKTSHSHNEKPLFLSQLDSFVYTFNDRNLLIEEKRFRKSYQNPFRLEILRYEYYCNDLLQMSFIENLPQTSRILYEYHGMTDCNLTEEQPEIYLYPNPADDVLTLESNFLATENVEIQLFSMAGKALWSLRLQMIAPKLIINLPELLPGYYLVVLKNDKKRVTEKLVVAPAH